MRQVISAVLCGVAVVWGVGVGPLCWVLRDGLGPDATESSGWAAVERFLPTFYWGPVALLLSVCCVIGWQFRTGQAGRPNFQPGAAARGGG